MSNTETNRRGFLASATAGLAAAGGIAATPVSAGTAATTPRLPREVWAVMESLSPDVRVDEVLKEFGIESFTAQNDLAAEMYKSHRIHP